MHPNPPSFPLERGTIHPMYLTHIPSNSLRLTGADRLDFLQGQMTAHLKAAPTPGRVPALFLSVRGQIEFFAQVYKRPDDLYLHLAAGQATALEQRFKKYIIFDRVEVQNVSSVLSTVHLWGELSPEVTQKLAYALEGAETQITQVGEMTLLISKINRTGQAGLEVHVLNKHLEELINLLALEEKPHTEVQNARVRAGIPDPLEDGFLGDLPQECGLEYAVSYKKGCYIGQEIMARLEARGNSRHRLALLEGQNLPSHFDLEREGKKMGRTGLSVGNVVLARLRKELEDGSSLEVGGSSVTVRDLPASFKVF